MNVRVLYDARGLIVVWPDADDAIEVQSDPQYVSQAWRDKVSRIRAGREVELP